MSARVRKPPSRQIPCRVMTKSVDNEEHSYVPDTESIPKFDGVAGCKITQKNKCMGDYRCIYPMLDPDGKTRLVTERDFHQRIRHKYRHFEGYDYIYPVLTVGMHEGKRSDLIPAPKIATCFVPKEVDRMIPEGVEQILTDYVDRSLLFIASRRGDIYAAATKTIPFRENFKGDVSEISIKSVCEVNEEAEPKPSKKQLRDIERWKKQMEELNRFSSHLCGNRIVYFGCEVNREEWKDDDIMSWFAENYPEDEEGHDVDDNGDTNVCVMESSRESSIDDCDSGYVDNQNHPLYLSQFSSETVNSEELRPELEEDVLPTQHQDDKEVKELKISDECPELPSQCSLISSGDNGECEQSFGENQKTYPNTDVPSEKISLISEENSSTYLTAQSTNDGLKHDNKNFRNDVTDEDHTSTVSSRTEDKRERACVGETVKCDDNFVPNSRLNCESTDNNSVRSEVPVCADEILEQLSRKDSFERAHKFTPERIALLVKSISDFSGDLKYQDTGVSPMDSCLMAELINKSQNCARSFQNTRKNIQIPLV